MERPRPTARRETTRFLCELNVFALVICTVSLDIWIVIKRKSFMYSYTLKWIYTYTCSILGG